MIIPKDIKPEKSLYTIGANIISLLKTEQMGIYDISLLYNKLITTFPDYKRLSFNYFTYAIIWLYLSNILSLNEEGDLVRCF